MNPLHFIFSTVTTELNIETNPERIIRTNSPRITRICKICNTTTIAKISRSVLNLEIQQLSSKTAAL